ncbi:unnamed protein product [Didymodactylos carnosus]|uniref:Uncharacterized protein n=1 Tax=Didymodactylos carnosus TaxID=1234261 RepID=A0A813RZX2_9BILA|nr:unnamed protein product [Didymodactylos carnosus]CAF1187491.1 unnamed protein product [Didymodactylos carnosus]CAF3572282.1 unnamed protein product [Didymodactylos carnosus]CAF3998467.1 unnamed protein product [Didymodactylos carnosus]
MLSFEEVDFAKTGAAKGGGATTNIKYAGPAGTNISLDERTVDPDTLPTAATTNNPEPNSRGSQHSGTTTTTSIKKNRKEQ